jgi:hypothetical protein
LNGAGGGVFGNLSLTCVGSPPAPEVGSGAPSDAKSVIEQEDAGGRYFRHVASQALVEGRNWRATVAAIDYEFGDGQKERVNQYLACDAVAARPCLSVTVSKPSHLTSESASAVRTMIERVAVPEPASAPRPGLDAGRWPDVRDWQAAAELAQAVRVEVSRSPEWALEQVLAAHEPQSEAATFDSDERAESQECAAGLPSTQPPGVSAEEWQALQRAHFASEGDCPSAYFFRLQDVDGDGRRDLVVDEMMPGRQSDGPTRLYRRVGDHFAGFGESQDNGDEHLLYMQAYPGADGRLRWISVRGRIYAAYVAREYGEDTLRLFRPFEAGHDQSLAVAVRYQYKLKVPRHQQPEGRPAFDIPEPEWREMQAVLRRISEGPATAEQDVDSVVCPSLPRAGAEDVDAEDGRFGPGHSSYESITDFALHVSGHCVPARLMDWFGGHAKGTGLGAAIWTHGGSALGDAEYEVVGVRRVVAVEDPSLSADPWMEN